MLTLRCSAIDNNLVLVQEEVLANGDALLLLQERVRGQPGGCLCCLGQALLCCPFSSLLLCRVTRVSELPCQLFAQ